MLTRIVEKRVAKAIEEYEKTRTDSNNAGGSGSTNTGGTVAPEMHGCSYNDISRHGKLTISSETKGVVGWKRWFEKRRATENPRMEQVLWTLTLKGDDIEAYNNRFHELGIKGNVTSSKPATLHDAINMARELIEQGVQAKALRIGDSNKRKWEDQQGNNYYQQQNQDKEVLRFMLAAPLGHQEGECRTRIPVARDNSLQNVTCFGCGNHGHYRSDCPKLKNRN
ncbi:putative reverse transcriptase domain-containing protein [Tanacetum coccineum]